MAIILFDQKTFKVRVSCSHDEKFEPNEELKEIVKDAELLADDFKSLNKKLSNFLTKVNRWNEKNDKQFAKAVEQQRQKIKEQQNQS